MFQFLIAFPLIIAVGFVLQGVFRTASARCHDVAQESDSTPNEDVCAIRDSTCDNTIGRFGQLGSEIPDPQLDFSMNDHSPFELNFEFA